MHFQKKTEIQVAIFAAMDPWRFLNFHTEVKTN